MKTLATYIISRALDDICPLFENEPQELRETKILERLIRIRQLEIAFDGEFEQLQESRDREMVELFVNRTFIIRNIIKRRNNKRLRRWIKRKNDARTVALKKIEKKRGLELSKTAKKLLNHPEKEDLYTREVNKVFSDYQLKIDEINSQFDMEIEAIKTQSNVPKIKKQIEASQQTSRNKIESLERKYEQKIAAYNVRRNDEDQIRVALDWFVYDFNRVLELCKVAGLDIKACYLTVSERLSKINRESDEIEEILERIERHEY